MFGPGTYENTNEMYLADALDSIQFLVYDDGTQSTCSRPIFQKSAILLKNSPDAFSVPRPFISRDFMFQADVVTSVPDLEIGGNNPVQLFQNFRNLAAEVLNILLGETSKNNRRDVFLNFNHDSQGIELGKE